MSQWRKTLGGTFIVFLFLFSLLPASQTSAAPYQAEGQALLIVTKISHNQEICKDTTLPLTFEIQDPNNLNIPVPGVKVEVRMESKSGIKTESRNTDSAGIVNIPIMAEEEGEITFTVTASKETYTSAEPITYKRTVIPCAWEMKTHCWEEMVLTRGEDKKPKLVVGAVARWEGIVKIKDPPQVTKAEYIYYAKDLTFDTSDAYSVVPEVKGPYTLDISFTHTGDGKAAFYFFTEEPANPFDSGDKHVLPDTITFSVTYNDELHTMKPLSAFVATNIMHGTCLEANDLLLITGPIRDHVVYRGGRISGTPTFLYDTEPGTEYRGRTVLKVDVKWKLLEAETSDSPGHQMLALVGERFGWLDKTSPDHLLLSLVGGLR